MKISSAQISGVQPQGSNLQAEKSTIVRPLICSISHCFAILGKSAVTSLSSLFTLGGSLLYISRVYINVSWQASTIIVSPKSFPALNTCCACLDITATHIFSVPTVSCFSESPMVVTCKRLIFH